MEMLVDIQDLVSQRGRLIVVSGPSGVGKDTVLDGLLMDGVCPQALVRCVTATTRDPRPGEKHGLDYFFYTREEFERRIAGGFFLEYAEYNHCYYGTPLDYVEAQRALGHDVVLKIEVQGALQVKRRVCDAVLIFIGPPSFAELERRLRDRGTDDEPAVLRRLAIAREELVVARQYDYLVVNDVVEHAVDRLRAVITAERSRINKP